MFEIGFPLRTTSLIIVFFFKKKNLFTTNLLVKVGKIKEK